LWTSTRRRRSRFSTAVRAGAVATLVAGFALPLARRRLRLHPAVTVASIAAAPVALAILRPRTKARDAALFALQMWAFTIAHELPYDDPAALRRRLRVRYPIRIDRAIGGGELPTVRLQRRLSQRGEPSGLDRVLTIVHWAWFIEPHLALVWILVRHNDRFAAAARQMAAAYDLGCIVYALLPTAPPWWAAEQGYAAAPVRRVMVEVGEPIWGRAWPFMYETLGGNPWAAFPSLHFGTSALAAILLAETGAVEGVAGWAYAGTLGFALVYLGEHYMVDLVGGAVLVAVVRLAEARLGPVAGVLSRGVQSLERLAHG
jgi:membrane-associated phospholipid phosphatase